MCTLYDGTVKPTSEASRNYLKNFTSIYLYLFPADVENKKHLTGSVVAPTTPKEKDGIYWGYAVRLANSFSAVFTESPYKSGYDLTLGTSERGEIIDQMELPHFK